MPTNQIVQDVSNSQSGLPRALHLIRREGSRVAWIIGGALLLSTANGCLATRSWVQDQMNPMQSQLNNTDAKADKALAGLQNLHLEKKLVLDSTNGPTFATGSAVLTANGKREINGFIEDLEGPAPANAVAASGRIFVVAGYTDNVGGESYNYQLGQRRAEGVAGYLVGKEGVDPTQIRAVSYGESRPVADNSTARGRRTNRRVEILVYQENITAEAERPVVQARN
jgi:outer membrane protein OmpA-like peptidoglycan-associated protein